MAKGDDFCATEVHSYGLGTNRSCIVYFKMLIYVIMITTPSHFGFYVSKDISVVSFDLMMYFCRGICLHYFLFHRLLYRWSSPLIRLTLATSYRGIGSALTPPLSTKGASTRIYGVGIIFDISVHYNIRRPPAVSFGFTSFVHPLMLFGNELLARAGSMSVLDSLSLLL